MQYGKVRNVQELGELIRKRRKEAGFVQDDTAGLTGVGRRFLSELERGKETAEIGLVFRVLERLGLELRVTPRGTKASDWDQHE